MTGVCHRSESCSRRRRCRPRRAPTRSLPSPSGPARCCAARTTCTCTSPGRRRAAHRRPGARAAVRGARPRAASSSSRTTPRPRSAPRSSARPSRASRSTEPLALNRAVGGMNPVAVEIAAREGARTVWFPTVDSVNESGEETQFPPGAKARCGWSCSASSAPPASRSSRCRWSTRRRSAARDARGAPRVARHRLVLATGHLARDGIFAVVEAALEEGVRRDRGHPPGVPLPGPVGGRPGGARRAGRAPRALLHDAVHGQGTWESDVDNIRATGPENRCSPPTSASPRTHRSRTGSR